MDTLSLTKEAKIHNGEKTISLTSVAGKTGQPFVKDVKKAERQRIDAFELWCWRRLLRVPWTARRSNQPTLDTHWKD